VPDDVLAGRNLRNDSLDAAILGQLHVRRKAPCKGEDLGRQAQGHDVLDGGFVFSRYGRHARLDPVYARFGQLPRDGHFFVTAEDDAGLLFAVPQGDVVDLDRFGERHSLSDFG
jgi:hypothetical protein